MINTLYNDVCRHIGYYQELPESELNSRLLKSLFDLYDLCRLHPDIRIRELEDLDLSDLEIIPISDEERAVMKNEFDTAIREELKRFLAENKIPKSKFAETYGCTPSYLSNALAGRKNLDFLVLVGAVQRFGFEVHLNPETKQFTFKKK